jgi:hypothetical protein
MRSSTDLPSNTFEKTIGISKSELENVFKCFDELSADVEIQLTPSQARPVHNALNETLRDLGVEEFHIRTGFDFTEGERVLKRLASLLG